MIKKILAIALVIILALALALSLGGCKDKDKGGGKSKSPDVSADADDDTIDAGGGGGGGSGGDAAGDSGDSEGLLLSEGDDWPDNALTKQIPKPRQKVLKGYFAADYGYAFFDLSNDEAKAYAEELKDAGFTEDVAEEDKADSFYYSAWNGAGYKGEVFWSNELGASITVGKR